MSHMILLYENINSDYCRASYGEFKVVMMNKNGFINATKLCISGGKRLESWHRNSGSKEMIEFFTSQLNTECKIGIAGGKNTEISGTYVHRYLIPHIASWVSPTFSFKVSRIVDDFLIKERQREVDIRDGIIKEKDTKIESLERMIKQTLKNNTR